MSDICYFCGDFFNEPSDLKMHELSCSRRSFGEAHNKSIRLETENAVLRRRLAEAEVLLSGVLPSCQFWGGDSPKAWARQIEAFLSPAPDNCHHGKSIDCFDGGNCIGTDCYFLSHSQSEWVVVRRDQAEQILSALEEDTIEYDNLKATLERKDKP